MGAHTSDHTYRHIHASLPTCTRGRSHKLNISRFRSLARSTGASLGKSRREVANQKRKGGRGETVGKTVGRRLLALIGLQHPTPCQVTTTPIPTAPTHLYYLPLCARIFPHCCLSLLFFFACGPLNRILFQRFNCRGTEGGEPRGTGGDEAGEERRAGRRRTAESLLLLSLARRARQTREGAGGLGASARRTCDF